MRMHGMVPSLVFFHRVLAEIESILAAVATSTKIRSSVLGVVMVNCGFIVIVNRQVQE